MPPIKVLTSKAAEAEFVNKFTSTLSDQSAPQQVDKALKTKYNESQTVPLTLPALPATSAVAPATPALILSSRSGPVKPENHQLNLHAALKEVIEITDNNGDELDPAEKAVPRLKTPTPLKATDLPLTGQSGPATDMAANLSVPSE